MAFAKNLIPEVLKWCLRQREFPDISCWICHTAAYNPLTHSIVCVCEQVLIHHNTRHLPYHMPPSYRNLKPATVSRGTHNFHLCFVWQSLQVCNNFCFFLLLCISSFFFFCFCFLGTAMFLSPMALAAQEEHATCQLAPVLLSTHSATLRRRLFSSKAAGVRYSGECG